MGSGSQAATTAPEAVHRADARFARNLVVFGQQRRSSKSVSQLHFSVEKPFPLFHKML
jgi:hypothetical protein